MNPVRHNKGRQVLVALLVASAFVSVLFGRIEKIHAAAFTVNSLGDTGAGSGTTGDLRYCITQANASGGSHTINFSVTGTINLLSALPNLSSSALTINGPGANLLTIRRDSSVPTLRIFLINSGGAITLSGLTLANGNAVGGAAVFKFFGGTLNINNCVLANNAGGTGGGGAIQDSGAGAINITDSTFSGNSANGGEGGAIRKDGTGTLNISGSAFSGNSATNLACIHNNNTGTINITNTLITGNSATFDAGAINNGRAGAVTVTGCTITNNTAGNVAGAIKNGGTGTVTVTDSTISGNSSASGGGGIWNNTGIINLIRSTLSNNSINNAFGSGGGIHNNGAGTINVTNSTISGNRAGSSGVGGGFNFSNAGGAGQAVITSSTITGNNAATAGGVAVTSGISVTLKNTIIAGNTANNSSKDISGPLASGGYNLIGNNTGGSITPTTGDQIGASGSPINALLGPLQNNGGPTFTHALLANSPALDAGNAFGLTADQRGAARPFDNSNISPAIGGDNSDIGAVEFSILTAQTGVTRAQGSPVSNSQIATANDFESGAGGVTVTVASANPANGVTVSNIVNINGTITADIVAACAATNASFTLQASNGTSTGTATLNVAVTANTAPILSYNNQNVDAGNSLIINPATGLSDNGSIASVMVQSQGSYAGTISVNSSGAVTISDARPAGVHAIVIRAIDNCGGANGTTDAAFLLTVNCPTVTLNPASLPDGLVGAAYNQRITATSGTAPYSFIVSSGTAPAGLTLNGDGTWSGAPTTANNYSFTVRATDINGCEASQAYSLTITNTCIWNGSVSNNWNTAANWTPGFVPSAPNDVIIPASGVSLEAMLSAAMATVNNLTIANGRTLTLSGQNLMVNGTLTLSGGLIDTGTNTLTLGLAASISRTSGQVVGNLRKQFGSASSFTYTVGTANGYSPIDVTVTAGAGDLTVKAVEAPHPIVNASRSLKRYWSLTGSGVTANLVFHYLDPLDIPAGGSDVNYQIIRVSGSTASSFPNDCANGSPCVNSTANTATIIGLTNFSDWTLGEPSAPTAIDLAQFSATSFDNGVFIRWQSGFEASNLGFNLYRVESGKRVPVNSQLIAGSALLAGANTVLKSGRSYSFFDSSASNLAPSSYWLEDLDLNGLSTWHGPFSANFAQGPAPSRNDSPFIAQIAPAPAGLTRPLQHPAQLPSIKSELISAQSSLASAPAVKLQIKREGWYKVTASELAQAGLDPRARAAFLQLYVDGQQVPINVVVDSAGQLAAVEFFGRGIDAAFTDSRLYWLIAGTKPGLRIPQVKAAGYPAIAPSFLCSVERKDRTIYFSGLLNGERENFFGAVIASQPVEQTLDLQGVEQSASSAATLEVALQGVTMQPHRVWVYVNDLFAGEMSFNGQAEGRASFSVSQSALKSGNNDVKFVSQGGPSDISLVDYIRLAYWHRFEAENNALQFTATGKQSVTIKGFTSGAIRVLDVTEPDSAQELAAKIERQKSGYAVTVTSPEVGERRLVAFAEEESMKPAKIEANRASNWRSATNGANLIVITRQDWAGSLQPLILLRQSEGLKVAVVDIEDIYDEFSYGNKSPQAVKDFLSYATRSWKIKPGYALMAGDASYDGRNYLGYGEWDIVPTKLVDTELMEAASDEWFADFNDDGLGEMAMGRLPARSEEELRVMVRKITSYERTESSESVLLVADRNDQFDFEEASKGVGEMAPGNLRVRQINRGQMEEEEAKRGVLEAIGEGQKIINYIGHGSVDVWRGGLLTNEDAERLTNEERLTVFVMMTCLNGYFDDPAIESLAERLVKMEGGGAVAAWASSGMTRPDEQSEMNKQLYRLLLSSGRERIGEAVRGAKAATKDQDARRVWILIGDPTMRLK